MAKTKTETHFFDIKITMQTGKRPVFNGLMAVHSFDKDGISGAFPMVELSEDQNRVFLELCEIMAGFGLQVLVTHNAKKEEV